jgi:hypothetical protein
MLGSAALGSVRAYAVPGSTFFTRVRTDNGLSNAISDPDREANDCSVGGFSGGRTEAIGC